MTRESCPGGWIKIIWTQTAVQQWIRRVYLRKITGKTVTPSPQITENGGGVPLRERILPLKVHINTSRNNKWIRYFGYVPIHYFKRT